MKRIFAITAVFAFLGMGIAAYAAITIDTVAVGNAGNKGDTTSFGAVGYNYNIGKYEVTAGQYTAFLNAKAKTDNYGLYNMSMSNTNYGSGITRSGSSGSYTYTVDAAFVNRPVNYVSYWDSCRFANWLGNGQLIGEENASTTETGAYTLGGYNGADGRTIQRNTEWTWAVTSEDEWYKAAYYDPNKAGGAGYWDYPIRDDYINTSMANFGTAVGHTTNVGAYANSSAYGTFDQGGNLWEWNEAIVYQDTHSVDRGTRGGALFTGSNSLLASARNFNGPLAEWDFLGFRVSQVAGPAVPEPTSLMLAASGLISLLGIKRRRRA